MALAISVFQLFADAIFLACAYETARMYWEKNRVIMSAANQQTEPRWTGVYTIEQSFALKRIFPAI